MQCYIHLPLLLFARKCPSPFHIFLNLQTKSVLCLFLHIPSPWHYAPAVIYSWGIMQDTCQPWCMTDSWPFWCMWAPDATEPNTNPQALVTLFLFLMIPIRDEKCSEKIQVSRLAHHLLCSLLMIFLFYLSTVIPYFTTFLSLGQKTIARCDKHSSLFWFYDLNLTLLIHSHRSHSFTTGT